MHLIENKELKKIIVIEEHFKIGGLYEALSSKLIKFTDVIFYNCGLYDKLYYDSSLINSLCQVPSYYDKLYFKFEDLIFTNPHSIFYFKNRISFSGTMWENLKEFKID